MRKIKMLVSISSVFLYLILWAVFYSNVVFALSDEDRSKDIQIFSQIDNKNPVSEYQIRYREKSDLVNGNVGTDGGGLCNVSAVTTLLNRRLAADNRSGRFTVTNVLNSLGCKGVVTDGKLYSDIYGGTSGTKIYQYYYFSSGTTAYWAEATYSNGSYSYSSKRISGSTVKNATTKENFYSYIAELLHQHPEGIAIRNTKANHVAVIYKYAYSNSKYQLYVKDPVYNYSGTLEGSYIYKQSGNDLYSNIDFISYINGTCEMASNGGSSWTVTSMAETAYKFNKNDDSRVGPGESYAKKADYSTGDVVIVIGSTVNQYNSTWYKLIDGNYVYSGDVDKVTHSETSFSGTYAFNKNNISHKLPYENSTKVRDYENGATVTVTAKVINGWGNIWYKITDGGYVWSGNVTEAPFTPTLTISDVAAPSGTLEKGKSFTLRGNITSNENITLVRGRIINRATNGTTHSKEVNPNKTSYSIAGSPVDTSLKFNELTDGIYRYILEATTSSGLSKVLVTRDFTVGTGTNPISVTSVSLNAATIDLTVDQTYSLTATVKPDNATNKEVNWSSLDSSVAIVSKTATNTATITAKGEGTTTITATAADGSGKSASVTVKVTKVYNSINMPSGMGITMGNQRQIPASMGSTTDFNWTSSNGNIVRVNSSGYIYGVQPGSAVITATTYDGNTSGTCTVTVSAPTAEIDTCTVGWRGSMYTSDVSRSYIKRFVPDFSMNYVFESRYDEYDTYGYIFDSSWNCLAYDDDSAGNGHFRINLFLQAGQTYYLVARMWNPFEDGVLTLALDRETPQQSISLSEEVLVTIDRTGEIDFFSFTPNETGIYRFYSECLEGEDPYGYIYKSDWTLLTYDDDSGNDRNFSINYNMEAGTTYYLGAKYYSSSSTGWFVIYVEKFVAVTGVSLDSQGRGLKMGYDGTPLVATVTPSNATNQTLMWSSSNSEIATVNSNGVVTGIKPGATTITVTTVDGGYTAVCDYHIFDSGSCGDNGDNVWWKYTSYDNSEFVLELDGTGAMYDYNSLDERPWNIYKDTIHSISVESGITRIGNNCFKDLDNLASVSLPQSLQTIGESAFYGSGVSDIWIPRGVTSIESLAFTYCNKLTSINIPSTVTSIGSDVFYGSTNLARIDVAVANEKYHSEDGVLFDEWSLVCFPAGKVCAEYTIPDTVSWINRTAFSFSKVNSVQVPDSVHIISYYAFSYTSNLRVTIPKSVTYIVNGVFAESENVTVYCFEESTALTYCIDNNINYVLIDTPLNNPDFLVPSALKTIESEAFSGIAAKRVKLAEGVKTIGSKAFANCPNLVGIYIPASCTSIASNAFYGVSDITVYGHAGSYAETFAKNHSWTFINIYGGSD